MPLAGVGSVVIPHLSLFNIYLISKLRLNLASVGQLCDSGDYLVIFFFFFCCVQDLQSQKLIGTGRRENGLYILDELKVPVATTAATTTIDLSFFLFKSFLFEFLFMAFSFRSCFVFSFEIFSIHRSFRKFTTL
jgi:hypothetical protein